MTEFEVILENEARENEREQIIDYLNRLANSNGFSCGEKIVLGYAADQIQRNAHKSTYIAPSQSRQQRSTMSLKRDYKPTWRPQKRYRCRCRCRSCKELCDNFHLTPHPEPSFDAGDGWQ